jgi:hypothetical protein
MLTDVVGRTLVKSAHHQCWQHALQVLGPTAEYYGLWPVDHLSAPWNLLAEALYQQVIYQYLLADSLVIAMDLFYWPMWGSSPPAVTHSPAAVIAYDAYLCCLQVATLPVIWCPAADGNSGRWIAPQQAELPDEACRLDGQLRAALLAAGVPLADPRLPPAVCSMLLAHSPGAEALRPTLLRQRLAAPGWRFAGVRRDTRNAVCSQVALAVEAASAGGSAPDPRPPTAVDASTVLEEAIGQLPGGECSAFCISHAAQWCAGSDAEAQAAAPLLLQQCLEDVLDDDATSVAQLAGLPLAPLADGRRGTLQLASQAGAAGATVC